MNCAFAQNFKGYEVIIVNDGSHLITYLRSVSNGRICRSISFGGLPQKFRVPSIMVKYHMVSLLVILIHFADIFSVKMNDF